MSVDQNNYILPLSKNSQLLSQVNFFLSMRVLGHFWFDLDPSPKKRAKNEETTKIDQNLCIIYQKNVLLLSEDSQLLIWSGVWTKGQVSFFPAQVCVETALTEQDLTPCLKMKIPNSTWIQIQRNEQRMKTQQRKTKSYDHLPERKVTTSKMGKYPFHVRKSGWRWCL